MYGPDTDDLFFQRNEMTENSVLSALSFQRLPTSTSRTSPSIRSLIHFSVLNSLLAGVSIKAEQ